MKKLFTLVLAVSAVVNSYSVYAQNNQWSGEIKPEVRRMDAKYLSSLKSDGPEIRADYTPFPDSTITYDLNGVPIRKTLYVYNDRGDQISYIAYSKEEGTTNWIESEKQVYTYDSAGRLLSGIREVWDAANKVWTGDYKFTAEYNSSGQEIFYESYIWDSLNGVWIGSAKSTTDYETGNRRNIDYNWDTNTKSWIPSERNEYISETIRYRERWNVTDKKWDWLCKIESVNIVNYEQSGLHITITEEHWIDKLDNGQWDENYSVYISYNYYSPDGDWEGWFARNFRDYKVSYDNAGNINSVTLTDYFEETFITNFTYDYTVNKVNSQKVYYEGVLIEHQSFVYDGLRRIIEVITHFDHDSERYDTKYAYTYIGDSQIRNSIEYYLWNGSSFVKQTKNMYIRNAEGRIIMYQTYIWAETKWILSSYTIYYPNEYTSDLEFEETESVGSDNKGAFQVGFNLPQDAEVTGFFYITFPKGFVLDEENTLLSDALAEKYTITITRQEKANTWLVDIKVNPEFRNTSVYSESAYKQILTVAFNVDEDTQQGDYIVEIENLNFVLSDGTILIEQQRNVPITVDRYGVANEQVAIEEVKVSVNNELITIDSPNAEVIDIYTLNGKRVYSAPKNAGKSTISVSGWAKEVYVLTGSKGWTAKVIVK